MNIMKTPIRTVLIMVIATVLLLAGTVFSRTTHAVTNDSRSNVCQGIGLVSGASDCQTPSGTPGPGGLIRTVVNILSAVVGIIAVITVIIGGLKFITSGGDSTAASSARNTVLYAVIGLVVVALAQIIVRYVLFRVNNSAPL